MLNSNIDYIFDDLVTCARHAHRATSQVYPASTAGMDDNNKPITLDGDEALKLWRQGREVWNQWVKENPIANVDFSNVDFSKERVPAKSAISFKEYNFPRGAVSFDHATFGDGDVTFSEATFGDGDVSFFLAIFGDGHVWFESATFGDGSVSFESAIFSRGLVFFDRTIFGDGGVSFDCTTFGDGGVSFDCTTFGVGGVSFCSTTFGGGCVVFNKVTFVDGNVRFNHTNFGDGAVSFDHATFGDGDVTFFKASFGDDFVSFDSTTFGVGGISFESATFGDDHVSLNNANFGEGNVSFEQAHFKGHVTFAALRNAGLIKSFSLRHAIFEKSLDLSQNNFNCVIDLTNTKMANQVSLEDIKCLVTKNTTEQRDIARLRRLKEIAEINKSHKQALAFHADEMRVMRWHDKTMGRAASVLDWLFDEMSDYGQSIIRPVELIIVVSLGFFLLYLSASDNVNSITIFKAIDLTTANMLPFLPSAKPIIMSSLNALYQTSEAGSIPVWYNLASLLQSFVIFVLLFLIGLGIRNRFRI